MTTPTGREPALATTKTEKLYEVWVVFPNHDSAHHHQLCLGVFSRDDAIAALLSFNHYHWGKDNVEWDGHQMIIHNEPRMVGWNGGFLWVYGVPKR